MRETRILEFKETVTNTFRIMMVERFSLEWMMMEI